MSQLYFEHMRSKSVAIKNGIDVNSGPYGRWGVCTITSIDDRGIDRWGHIKESGLHIDSIAPLLRAILRNAGMASADAYSGHSLRRGFANWAASDGWDVKSLMEYVGWRDIKSALKYLDSSVSFAKGRMENSMLSRVPESDMAKSY